MSTDEVLAAEEEPTVYYGGTVTVNGRDLLANLMKGETIELTRIMVGDGTLPAGVEPIDMKDLVNPLYEAQSTVPDVVDNTMYMTVEYRNDMNGGLKTGFWLREFGIYAKTDHHEEVLLYYATLGNSPQPVNAFKDNRVDTRRYPISISLALDAEVTVTYNPGAFVTSEEVHKLVDGMVKEAIETNLPNLVGDSIDDRIKVHNEDPNAHAEAFRATVEDAVRGLATSEELKDYATKEELSGFTTKEDLAAYATKEDLKTYVTTTAVQELVDQAIQDASGAGGAIETAVENTFNRLVSEGVTVDRTEVQKIIKETISSGGGTYSGVMTLTIPAADWAAAETPTEEYAYTCDVEAPGVTAEHWPSGGPNHGSFTVAQEAGLLGGCETMDGYVRFFAQRIPTGDIQATIAVFAREKASSGGTGADVATADTAGVVKPGNGLTVAADGTLSLDLGGGLTYDETGKVTVDTVDEAAVQQEVSDLLSGEDANP